MSSLIGELEDPLGGAVAQAVAGDEAAFARIIRAHHDEMTRVCFLICADFDLADDAVQSAWLIAWRKLKGLRDPARLRPWLVSIAVNEARQVLRRRRRAPVLEIEVMDALKPGSDPAGRIGDLDLANALARLDADDRALLALRYVAGFDSTELARATGRSPSGTRARLARLLDRLRKDLGDD